MFAQVADLICTSAWHLVTWSQNQAANVAIGVRLTAAEMVEGGEVGVGVRMVPVYSDTEVSMACKCIFSISWG